MGRVLAGIDPGFSEHDGDDRIPVVEQESLQECGEFLKEGGPGAFAEAEGPGYDRPGTRRPWERGWSGLHRGQEIGRGTLSVPQIVRDSISHEL